MMFSLVLSGSIFRCRQAAIPLLTFSPITTRFDYADTPIRFTKHRYLSMMVRLFSHNMNTTR